MWFKELNMYRKQCLYCYYFHFYAKNIKECLQMFCWILKYLTILNNLLYMITNVELFYCKIHMQHFEVFASAFIHWKFVYYARVGLCSIFDNMMVFCIQRKGKRKNKAFVQSEVSPVCYSTCTTTILIKNVKNQTSQEKNSRLHKYLKIQILVPARQIPETYTSFPSNALKKNQPTKRKFLSPCN